MIVYLTKQARKSVGEVYKKEIVQVKYYCVSKVVENAQEILITYKHESLWNQGDGKLHTDVERVLKRDLVSIITVGNDLEEEMTLNNITWNPTRVYGTENYLKCKEKGEIKNE